jgi:H+/gluconate symporter-like permease
MEKSFKAHKEDLLKAQQGQKLRLKNQFVDTKDETTKVAKLALIGGASAFVGIKVVSFVFGMFRKKKRKKAKNQEPQIVYVQQGNEGTSVATKKQKGLGSMLWTLALPMITNFAKQTGTQLAEKYGKELMEKYKDKLNLDKFIK